MHIYVAVYFTGTPVNISELSEQSWGVERVVGVLFPGRVMVRVGLAILLKFRLSSMHP